MDLETHKFEVIIRQPTEQYGYVELKSELTIMESALSLAKVNEDFKELIGPKVPDKKDHIVSAPVFEPSSDPKKVEVETTKTDTEDSHKPKHCKYCDGTSFYHNKENKFNNKYFAKHYRCMNTSCKAQYQYESGKWWKPDPTKAK